MFFSRLDRYISQTCCLEVLCPRTPLYKLFPALKRMQLHLLSNGQSADDYITVMLNPGQLHQLATTVSHSSSLASLNQPQELGQTRLVRHPTSEPESRNLSLEEEQPEIADISHRRQNKSFSRIERRGNVHVLVFRTQLNSTSSLSISLTPRQLSDLDMILHAYYNLPNRLPRKWNSIFPSPALEIILLLVCLVILWLATKQIVQHFLMPVSSIPVSRWFP